MLAGILPAAISQKTQPSLRVFMKPKKTHDQRPRVGRKLDEQETQECKHRSGGGSLPLRLAQCLGPGRGIAWLGVVGL
jgi:hypothetical protein